ncbi:MAG: TRAP transporter small permease subunit [Methylococcales bacterium]|nr:TRAP transporter small permease subunit [Methylococcales bacterium]
MPSFWIKLRAFGMALEHFNRKIGLAVAWLTLIMVLTLFVVVVLRYGFNYGSIALQESVSFMHAAVFLLGAAYTLDDNAHVRVDIFYQRGSVRAKAWVDCLGTLLLLWPVALFIFFSSLDYVQEAWRIQESSSNPGGLPGIYLLKTLLLIFPVQLLIQSLGSLCARLPSLLTTKPTQPD